MVNQSTFNQSPEASDFVSTIGTNTGRKVLLGNPENFDTAAGNAIAIAHNAVIRGLARVNALTNDETRNDVLKHEAAKQIAEQTIGAIEKSHSSLLSTASQLQTDAAEMIESKFAADPDRSHIQLRIADWIKDNAAKPDGLQKIREVMKDDSEVAAVIFHTPHFLLGLAQEVRKNFELDAIERFVPEAYRKLEASGEISTAAEKYRRVTKGIAASWYNKSIAEKAKSRVEV